MPKYIVHLEGAVTVEGEELVEAESEEEALEKAISRSPWNWHERPTASIIGGSDPDLARCSPSPSAPP